MNPSQSRADSKEAVAEASKPLLSPEQQQGCWGGLSTRTKWLLGGAAAVLSMGAIGGGATYAATQANKSSSSGEGTDECGGIYSILLDTPDLYGVLTEKTAGTTIGNLVNGTLWPPMTSVKTAFTNYMNMDYLMYSVPYEEYNVGEKKLEGGTQITCSSDGCSTTALEGTLINTGACSYNLSYATPAEECDAYTIPVYRINDLGYSCVAGKVEPSNGYARYQPKVTTPGDNQGILILDPNEGYAELNIGCTSDELALGSIHIKCELDGSCEATGDEIILATTAHACTKEMYITNNITRSENGTTNGTTNGTINDAAVGVWEKRNLLGYSGIGRGSALFHTPLPKEILPEQNERNHLRKGVFV